MYLTATNRLEIRKFESSDVKTLMPILSDPDVMEYSSKGPLSEAQTAEFIDWCTHSYDELGYGQWAVIEKPSGRLIGYCGLSRTTVDGCDEVEIGYRLAKDRWGIGLATEAAREALGYGFEACNLKSVVAIVAQNHAASIHILEKLGFSNFIETRYAGWDVRLYRLTRSDWKPD